MPQTEQLNLPTASTSAKTDPQTHKNKTMIASHFSTSGTRRDSFER
jgi:hypothetical protein